MNIQVHVDQTVVIRPEKSNDDHDHIVLPLSHIDNDRNLNVILRYLRIYPPSSTLIDPFELITAALSSALVHYYPFAGTLRRRITDGRLELLCQADDGVAVTSASLDCDISQIIQRIHHNFVDNLAPHLDPDQDLIPPITLQVTKLRCGGFVLGAAVHHAICDGVGATLLFSAMAELARGLARVTVEPVWNRVELLGPKTGYDVEYPINDLLDLDKDFIPYSSSGERIIKEFVSVKDEWLDHLKHVLYQKSGFKFTTFEALGAFIWRARTKASEVSEDEKVTFAYSINIRNIVNPPLPEGYWGNGCVPMYVHLTSKELLNQPIWRTAALIKQSKYDVTNKYIRCFIQFQQLHYKDGIIAGRRVSGFTDWRHLGHSNVDFGWGGPVAVVPLSRHLLGSNEPCFLLPGKPGMIKVLAHLEETALLAFTQEMDKLKQHYVCFSSL